ncbi:hypothetical protein C805_00686 [Eubacterium sp. 14-2]|uniref:M56 family metallopeptidase n=1 Tax=Eubacterium sp. 14-2 TaxID=1235790 RepID=UPI00033DBF04|nr:M56 family metallopeptidase [Eubacterium sp. 14-2]EOT26586.1 hypothetical protein C805_00686 [Eubacterium sp. 14-2]
MSLWEMSVAGGILILAILPVRRLFRNRLPAGTFLVLWTIAFLRLLVPVSVPAPCNVYTLLEICGVELNPAGLPEIFRMSDTDWNSSETLEQNSVVKKAGSKEQDSAGSGRGDGNAIPDSGKQVRDWRNLFPWRLLYLAGVLGTAVFYGFTYLKCRREFCMALPVEDEAVQKFVSSFPVKRRVQVRQTDLLATPMTYGVLRPVILLPGGMEWENSRQMELVLTHELVHICRFDVLRKLLLVTGICVHWWNPLVWVMYVLAGRDMELACDERVIRHFGQESGKMYALSLISLAERRNHVMSWGNGFGRFSSHRKLPFGRNAMEERIVAIMKKKRFGLAETAGGAVLVVFVAVLFATSAAQKSAEETKAAKQEAAEHEAGYQEEDDRLTVRIPAPHVPYVDGSLGAEERIDSEQIYGEASAEESGFINLEEPQAEGDYDASEGALETDGITQIDFPEEYRKYGVTEEGKYKEKQIAVLYDAGHFIYCDGCQDIPESETTYLLIKRDAKDKIISFAEVTREEMQKSVEDTGLEL